MRWHRTNTHTHTHWTMVLSKNAQCSCSFGWATKKKTNGLSTEKENGIETFDAERQTQKCATRIKGIEVNHVNCGLSSIPCVLMWLVAKNSANWDIFKVLTLISTTEMENEKKTDKIHERDKKNTAVWLMILIFYNNLSRQQQKCAQTQTYTILCLFFRHKQIHFFFLLLFVIFVVSVFICSDHCSLIRALPLFDWHYFNTNAIY